MFIGAIEAEFRRWFALNRPAFQGRTIFVGCSGNFTIEQLLGEFAGAVHSNDVSIYTHFLGHHLASQEVECSIKDPAWEWLQPFLEFNMGACVVLLFELLKWDATKNIYQKRVHDHISGSWEWHFEKTCERVEAAKAASRVTTYRSSDIWDFVDEAEKIDPHGIFLAFLPFYKGGYEKLYKKLDAILAWKQPSYQVIDAERKSLLVEKIKRFEHVYIDDRQYEGQEAVMLKRKSATKCMWAYSNIPYLPHVLVQAHTKSEATYYPMMGEEDLAAITPDSVVTIKRVPSAEINYFRNRYLAKGIEFVNGSWSFLFFLDSKLFGFAILTLSKFGGSGLYLLSDFVIPLQDSRLSKLLVMLLQSTHFRDVAEELVLAKVPSLYTTAFTEKPVSMKYRGAWELAKRGEKDGKKYLNYETQTGLHTDKEAIAKWIKSRKKSKN